MTTRKSRGGPMGGPVAGSAAAVGSASSNVEVDIERAREESDWKKVIQLAEHLKQRPEKQYETLANFLIGEAKLEDFLEEFPPQERHTARAREGLAEAKEHLNKTIGDDAKKLGVHLDSFILLGKLNYAIGNYAEALRFYEKAQLDSLEEKQLPARSLKIMAEAFAIKAMCFEKVSVQKSSSKAKAVEREATIIRCYETAGDLTLLFLQVADKTALIGQSTWSVTSAGTSSSPVPPLQSSTHKLGPILERALLRAPALCLKAGQKIRAINRFRTMLQAEESESTKVIRRSICWKLAEVLLHEVSDSAYVKPHIDEEAARRSVLKGSSADSPWKPRRHNGSNLYCPRSKQEEILLLLLLSENMVRKDAILSQAPEFFGMRSTKFKDAIITYDLMTVALSRVKSFKLLRDLLEHSMKFSFNEPHTWTQFGLALATENEHLRSLNVFRELAAKNQVDAATCLAMARVCYETLNFYDEGLEWSRRALKKDDSSPNHFLRSRCNVYLGIGNMLKVRTVENSNERSEMLTKAFENFSAARTSDLNDHLPHYHLAFFYAITRDMSRAMSHVKIAMDMQPEHLHILHLTILLLSANNEYEEALEVTRMTLDEYPDNLGILSLKVRLEEKVLGSEAAILTTKEMLRNLQAALETAGSDSHTNATSLNGIQGSYDQLSNPRNPGFDTLSDKDSVSLHAHSITASHVEKTLSEVASSFSSHFPRPGPQDPSHVQMRLWLLSAELHLKTKDILQAEQCLNEARLLSPLSYHVMFVRGLIAAKKGDLEDARHYFESSLGVNPSHVPSLQHLGQVYFLLGFFRLSEQALNVAIRIDPTSAEIWTLLGEVKEAIATQMVNAADELTRPDRIVDESDRTPTESTEKSLIDEASRIFQLAAKCHGIALKLQLCSPILPLATIPLCFE